MKKIINNPNAVVEEMLQGIEIANPDVLYDREGVVIARKEKSDKVGLVSGGGSGHEPAHAGYVGYGMLDAAVSGNVFASPSPDRVLRGIQLADSGHGVLLIIKNYAGDIMNFEIAEELAGMEGIEVDHVVVRDDVAVAESDDLLADVVLQEQYSCISLPVRKQKQGHPLPRLSVLRKKRLRT